MRPQRGGGKRSFVASDLVLSVVVFPMLCYFCYSPSLGRDPEFVFDDLPAVVDNPDVKNTRTNFTAIFTHDFWGDPIALNRSHKSYRPLTVLLFRALKAISRDGTPTVFRHIGYFIHTVNSLLVLAFVRRLIGSRLAWWPGLYFLTHPVHVEPVVTAVGLSDLTCAFLCLLALVTKVYCAIPNPRLEMLLYSAMSTLAVLFKEQGIMLIPLVLTLELATSFKDGKRLLTPANGLKLLGYSLVLCSTMFLRFWIMNFQGPTFQTQDNPAAFEPLYHRRILNRAYIYALNTWLLIAPDWLCFDWAIGCIPLLDQPTDPRLLLALIYSVCFILCGVKAAYSLKEYQNIVQFLAVCLYALPFLPASNVFFTVGFVIAERNLYLSLTGYHLMLMHAIKHLEKSFAQKSSRFCLKLGLFLLLVSFVCKSRLRSSEWRAEKDLFVSGVKVCPNNAKIYYNLGKRASDGNDNLMAEFHYLRALKLYPDYVQALNNLGNIYRKQKKYMKAKELLARAVALKGDFSTAWMNLATAESALRDYKSSERGYRTALDLRHYYPDCWYNLGNLYLKISRKSDAMTAFRTAIEQKPSHQQAWTNLIILADEEGDYQLAEKSGLQAIKLFPEDAEMHSHLAGVYGKQDRFSEAEYHYKKSLTLKDSSFVFGNLGVLYHRWKKYALAKDSYEKALVLDPLNQSAKRNLQSLNLL